MGFISKPKGVKLPPYRFPIGLYHIVFCGTIICHLPTFPVPTRYLRSKSYAWLFCWISFPPKPKRDWGSRTIYISCVSLLSLPVITFSSWQRRWRWRMERFNEISPPSSSKHALSGLACLDIAFCIKLHTLLNPRRKITAVVHYIQQLYWIIDQPFGWHARSKEEQMTTWQFKLTGHRSKCHPYRLWTMRIILTRPFWGNKVVQCSTVQRTLVRGHSINNTRQWLLDPHASRRDIYRYTHLQRN